MFLCFCLQFGVGDKWIMFRQARDSLRASLVFVLTGVLAVKAPSSLQDICSNWFSWEVGSAKKMFWMERHKTEREMTLRKQIQTHPVALQSWVLRRGSNKQTQYDTYHKWLLLFLSNKMRLGWGSTPKACHQAPEVRFSQTWPYPVFWELQNANCKFLIWGVDASELIFWQAMLLFLDLCLDNSRD